MGPAAKSIKVARRSKRGNQQFKLPNFTQSTSYFDVNQSDEANGTGILARKHYQTNTYKVYSLNTVPAYNPMAFEKQMVGACVPSVNFGCEAIRANTPGEITTDSYIAASVDYYVETEIQFEFSASHDFNFETFKLEMAARHGQQLGDTTAAKSWNNFNTQTRYGENLY